MTEPHESHTLRGLLWFLGANAVAAFILTVETWRSGFWIWFCVSVFLGFLCICWWAIEQMSVGTKFDQREAQARTQFSDQVMTIQDLPVRPHGMVVDVPQIPAPRQRQLPREASPIVIRPEDVI